MNDVPFLTRAEQIASIESEIVDRVADAYSRGYAAGEDNECKRTHADLADALRLAEERLAHANQLQADIENEQIGRVALRERFGALEDETMGAFIERLWSEGNKIDEGQRQMMLLALAKLSLERPGWDMALNELALKMDNDESGRAQMYDAFRKLHEKP